VQRCGRGGPAGGLSSSPDDNQERERYVRCGRGGPEGDLSSSPKGDQRGGAVSRKIKMNK